jgi:hypothetical protein
LSGDTIVGWKIAKIALSGQSEDFYFAAPVFLSSLVPGRTWDVVAPRVEVELVAKLEEPANLDADRNGTKWSTTWCLGLEVVSNHDRHWALSPGWAIADWGLHAAAVLGPQSRPPVFGATIPVSVTAGSEHLDHLGSWTLGYERLFRILDAFCERIARAPQLGDFIWTGALAPAFALTDRIDVAAEAVGFGSVVLTAPWSEGLSVASEIKQP